MKIDKIQEGHVPKILGCVFPEKQKRPLWERHSTLKAWKKQGICQCLEIQRYRVISWLISNHLEHSMRQIQLQIGPDWIRGVLGPGNTIKIKKTLNRSWDKLS